MRLYNYVLTCSRSKERLVAFKTRWRAAREYYFVDDRRHGDARFGELINAASNLRVVWGMNSERFPRSPWWRVGDKPTTVSDRQTGNGLDRRGHTACYWGHVQEWRQALGEHDADFETGAACFFEDDCELDVDFWSRVSEALDELPDDWDVLYFGGEHCVHGRPRPRLASEHLYRVENVNRTHAYCVRLRSLPRIILWFEEHHEWGHNFCDPKTGMSEAEVDYALGHLTETGVLTAYALKPWACGQASGLSLTQGRVYPRNRWEL